MLFAEDLRARYPEAAAMFESVAKTGRRHKEKLLDLYRERFGPTLPPYLVPDSTPNAFLIATAIASAIVFVELWIIAYVRARYMDTPFLKAALQIVLGGASALATGVAIGAS